MSDSGMIHPPVYVINLDARSDRWETITALCKVVGLEVRRYRSIATPAGQGWIGFRGSHQAIV